MTSYVDVVLDGPVSHECGRFVETETENGNSVNAGEWIDRGDGFHALRIAAGPWATSVVRARNATPPGLVALCHNLDVDGTPPALRLIARAFVEERLYRADRPRARTSDPETSQAAAEAVRGPARPGGVVHRILDAYRDHAKGPHVTVEHGLTSREVERWSRVKAAHKRTSELLADGLLEVVTHRVGEDGEAVEKVRDGGRVLRITNDGLVELARLDREKRVRDERAAAVANRKAARRAREARWQILELFATRDGFQPPERVGFTSPEVREQLGDPRDVNLPSILSSLIGQGEVEYVVDLELSTPGRDAPLIRGGYGVASITNKGVRALARRRRAPDHLEPVTTPQRPPPHDATGVSRMSPSP